MHLVLADGFDDVCPSEDPVLLPLFSGTTGRLSFHASLYVSLSHFLLLRHTGVSAEVVVGRTHGFDDLCPAKDPVLMAHFLGHLGVLSFRLLFILHSVLAETD